MSLNTINNTKGLETDGTGTVFLQVCRNENYSRPFFCENDNLRLEEYMKRMSLLSSSSTNKEERETETKTRANEILVENELLKKENEDMR